MISPARKRHERKEPNMRLEDMSTTQLIFAFEEAWRESRSQEEHAIVWTIALRCTRDQTGPTLACGRLGLPTGN